MPNVLEVPAALHTHEIDVEVAELTTVTSQGESTAERRKGATLVERTQRCRPMAFRK